MEDKMKVIEKMKADFENGLRPKQIADKYGYTANAVGGLARLLGYEFAPLKRDPRNWYAVTGSRQLVGFGAGFFNELKNIKNYRVVKVDAKTKTITIEWN